MTRIPQGPFGGLFDEIDYGSPAFMPVLVTSGILLFVWIAVVWLLVRRRSTRRLQQPAF